MLRRYTNLRFAHNDPPTRERREIYFSPLTPQEDANLSENILGPIINREHQVREGLQQSAQQVSERIQAVITQEQHGQLNQKYEDLLRGLLSAGEETIAAGDIPVIYPEFRALIHDYLSQTIAADPSGLTSAKESVLGPQPPLDQTQIEQFLTENVVIIDKYGIPLWKDLKMKNTKTAAEELRREEGELLAIIKAWHPRSKKVPETYDEFQEATILFLRKHFQEDLSLWKEIRTNPALSEAERKQQIITKVSEMLTQHRNFIVLTIDEQWLERESKRIQEEQKIIEDALKDWTAALDPNVTNMKKFIERALEDMDEKSHKIAQKQEHLVFITNLLLPKLKEYLERLKVEPEPVSTQTLARKAEQVQAILENMSELGNRKLHMRNGEMSIAEFLNAQGTSDDKAEYARIATAVGVFTAQIQEIRAIADALKAWKSGGTNPRQFPDIFEELHNASSTWEDPAIVTKLGKLREYVQKHTTDIDLWDQPNALNASTRQEIIQEMSRIAGLGEVMQLLHKQLEAIEETGGEDRKKVEAFFQNEEYSEKLTLQTGEVHSHDHRGLGIEFYSINEVWESLKKVGAAYKHAWHEKFELKATNLARRVGGILPPTPYIHVAEVRLNLDKAAESVNRKETNEYVEYLKERNFTFRDITLGHGEESLHHNAHEPNKARALLEYAATRGWLYDLAEAKAEGGRYKILGYYLDELCSDWTNEQVKNYFIKLVGQNTGGEQAEMKAGKEREQTTDRAELFIKAIDRELNDLNFWGAIGVAQRSIERGLAGEISPWIANRFLRVLREDPNARRFVNRQAFDQMGIICLKHSSFTLQYLKTERNTHLEKWVKKYPPQAIEAAGTLGNMIGQIERVIKERSGEAFESADEKAKLDRMVAQVLAAQTVEVREGTGRFVSIFESQFHDYHKARGQANTNPDGEDEDYFRYTSDVLLADSGIIADVLGITGSGEMKHGPKASYLIETILNVEKDLQQKNMGDALKNYKEIMGEKLENWISGWLKESRAGPAAAHNLTDDKTPAILQLITHGFIKFETIEETAKETSWRGASPLLCEGLMEQLADPSLNTNAALQARAWRALPAKVRRKILDRQRYGRP